MVVETKNKVTRCGGCGCFDASVGEYRGILAGDGRRGKDDEMGKMWLC